MSLTKKYMKVFQQGYAAGVSRQLIRDDFKSEENFEQTYYLFLKKDLEEFLMWLEDNRI